MIYSSSQSKKTCDIVSLSKGGVFREEERKDGAEGMK